MLEPTRDTQPPTRDTLRRGAAVVLAAAALAILAWRAGEAVAPIPVSFSVLKKFWRAGATTRLLNSGVLRREPELGATLVQRDRFVPLDMDVVLTVAPAVPPAAAEEMRRKAAFVLAPRRVLLARGDTGREPFQLRAAPPAIGP